MNQDEKGRYITALVEVASESWRIIKAIEQSGEAFQDAEKIKLNRQAKWLRKRIEDSLSDVDLKLVNLEGQEFDPGIAASPINIEDFKEGSRLIIKDMLEPTVMGESGIIKLGTVALMEMDS